MLLFILTLYPFIVPIAMGYFRKKFKLKQFFDGDALISTSLCGCLWPITLVCWMFYALFKLGDSAADESILTIHPKEEKNKDYQLKAIPLEQQWDQSILSRTKENKETQV